MIARVYEIAGIRLRVCIPKDWMYGDDGALTAFVADGDKWDRALDFQVVERLSDPEGAPVFQSPGKRIFRLDDGQIRYEGVVAESLDGAYLRIERRGENSTVQVLKSAIPHGITAKLVLKAMEAEHLICDAGGFLLHASWIEIGGKGILFTGPSGVGKSTQGALWCEHRGAELFNGDRAAVFGDHARGIPFRGSSGVGLNRNTELAAIVYLSQAPETTLTRLAGARAFRRLWEGCSVNIWNPADMERTTAAVMDTLSAVPVYHLACRKDITAIEALEKEGIV